MWQQARAGISSFQGVATRLMNRIAARTSTLARPVVPFTAPPEPRTIGSLARGRHLSAGNFLFAGHLVRAPGGVPWDITPPSAAFEAALHGFVWLDDLAALADGPARQRAQDWCFAWIVRFGKGRGPGWTPERTGRRLLRWIHHAGLVLDGQEQPLVEAYMRSLAQQTLFLSRRWQAAPAGLPRFEALAGLIVAAHSLSGMESHAAPALDALARECAREIDAGGAIPSRNPEELLEILNLLTLAAAALGDAGRMAPRAHLAAIERIVPTLRALRHADGGLARFHGGGRGPEGRLDAALAASGVKGARQGAPAMGYARLAAGRTTVIVDAAAPPRGGDAHASTLGFELTSGRRPVIVNCGSGARFGVVWHRAARLTPSHSVLEIEGVSSSRFGPGEALREVPGRVQARWTEGEGGETGLLLDHDGYVPAQGLTHVRELVLAADGRSLRGEDTLGAMSGAERQRFAALIARGGAQAVPYALRFHLHPDVEAALDVAEGTVTLTLKSGEVWRFRHDGSARLALEPSVYLEKDRLAPRMSTQIVLSSAVIDYASQIGWTLAKAQDTPLAIRDTKPAPDPALD